MNETSSADCCAELFSEFQFDDLRTAKPPNKRGVYAIRVKQRGKATSEIVTQVQQLAGRLDWVQVGCFILKRVKRLESIGQCPIIYIGSAGTRAVSKNTLLKRYKEFSDRHTAMYPIWALLYFGWELEFGWIEKENVSGVEKEIKEKYRHKHNAKLPVLVQR